MTTTRNSDAVGLRLVIAYKFVKAGAELVLATLLPFVARSALRDLAALLGRHVAGAWSLRTSELLTHADTPRAVALTALALALDGVLTLAEGWALHCRFAWAPWVVVISTGSLLPFEGFELARAPHPLRLLVFVVNLAIVWYLAAGRRARHSARPMPLAALQDLLDRSARTATPAVADSIAHPTRRMTAAELVEFWKSARIMAMTTVGANGQPHSAPVHSTLVGTTLSLVIYDNTVRRRDLRTNPRVSFTTWKDGAVAILYGRAREVPGSLRDARHGGGGAPRRVVAIEVELTRAYAMRAPEPAGDAGRERLSLAPPVV
ncbi:MAG: hypothetical protein B6D46_14405 [Polyangiaceae bacterium UTPRO1]|jgi:uncharacterized membrane protein (DUF2068 family)|nr:DUF2127 domain-containing protein [Myxococcales bacterium]OQY65299.1 MAG: hypothetical protein B6D46_14405 [Polyangiaceae bacterium UTPRO1]